jgi:hypothetical protein
MTNMPPGQPPAVPTPPTETTPHKSGLALTAFILGIVALIPLIGIPFGIGAIICGIIALTQIGKPPFMKTGKGFAITGIVLGGAGFLLAPVALMIAILLPSLSKARELANRAACAANLHGIGNSMMIYAATYNDQFPLLPYAPYSPANAGTSSPTPTAATADDAIQSMYAAGSPSHGSVLAAQWIGVLQGTTGPKLFICKSDTFATAPATPTDSSGKFFTNFQNDHQISYSFAYPYMQPTSNGAESFAPEKMQVGRWWKDTTNPSLPIAADMAPLNGTGTPARNVCPASAPSSNKLWNSGNHQGDGQNVAYADVHVDYTKRPDVGMANDNIYSFGGSKGPTDLGGSQPIKSPILLPDTIEPFDTYMVPARNLTTGGL